LGDENKENDVNVKLLERAGSGQSVSIENVKERINFRDLGVDRKRILNLKGTGCEKVYWLQLVQDGVY
jgi:hypothetical protein